MTLNGNSCSDNVGVATTAHASAPTPSTFVCGICEKELTDEGKMLRRCRHTFHAKCLKGHVPFYNNCPSCDTVMTPVRFEDFRSRARYRYLLKFGKRLNQDHRFRRQKLLEAVTKAFDHTHYHRALARIVSAKVLLDVKANPLEAKDPKMLRTMMIVNSRYQELKDKFIANEPHTKCVEELF